jgi:hypothetical protein
MVTCDLLRRPGALCLLIAFLPTGVAAQQEGTLAVGGSVALVTAPDPDVRGLPRVGPIIRYGERRDGWGPRIGFNWYAANVDKAVGGATERLGRLRVRPIMGGYGYTKTFGLVAVSTNVLAGYAFTSFSLQPSFDDAYAGSLGVDRVRTDVSNELVVKPEVSTWIDISGKIGINVSVGYMVARPTITLTTALGSDPHAIKADVVMLKVGLVYSVF